MRKTILLRLEDSDYDVRQAAVNALASQEAVKAITGERWLELVSWLQVDLDERRLPSYFLHTSQKLQERLAKLVGDLLPTDPDLLARVLEWLESPRWSVRLGAVMALVNWPEGPPEPIVQQVLVALDDDRGLESYPARLEAVS